MRRRNNPILTLLIVLFCLVLLALAGYMLVQVLPQKAPQEKMIFRNAAAGARFSVSKRNFDTLADGQESLQSQTIPVRRRTQVR